MEGNNNNKDKEAILEEAKKVTPMSPTISPTIHSVKFAALPPNTNGGEPSSFILDPKSQRFSALEEDYNEVPTYPLRRSYKDFHSQLRPASRVVIFDGCPDDPYRSASTPIYQTATFEQPSASEFGAYDYTRSGNPTRTALETQMAMLENAHAAFAFVTGMAALNAVTRLLKTGDTIVIGGDIYGGMHRLVSRITSSYGIKVRLVKTWDLNEMALVLKEDPQIALVHIETPSNPLMRITDIRALATLLSSKGNPNRKIYLSVDSTTMTPHLQQPINHGADIVVHSMTKFIGGHSDTMGGIVCVANEDLAKRIAFFQNAEGTGLSPFDSWLFLRGIKTLAIRVQVAQSNAQHIASFLLRHPVPKMIYYAGLEPNRKEMLSNSQIAQDHKVHMGQAKGGGSVLSFTTGSTQLSRRVINALRLFKLTVSFGSCNSLCEMPATLSHASIPNSERTFPEDLIRLSIGIEDVNDLLEDLQRAFSIALSKGNLEGEDGQEVEKQSGSIKTSAGTVNGSNSSNNSNSILSPPSPHRNGAVLAREPSTMHTSDRIKPELPMFTNEKLSDIDEMEVVNTSLKKRLDSMERLFFFVTGVTFSLGIVGLVLVRQGHMRIQNPISFTT